MVLHQPEQLEARPADYEHEQNSGGFNTSVTYKGFDLSLVGTFRSGGLLIATPYGSNGYLNILTDVEII